MFGKIIAAVSGVVFAVLVGVVMFMSLTGTAGHHVVDDLDSALDMCAADDVVDTRECAEWALGEY